MSKGIIIGAGIGGLTTAIALARQGIDVTVCEQAPEIKELGAGIMIAPNGLRVYEELGLLEEITAAAQVLDRISITDLAYKPIVVIDAAEVQARYGYKTIAIHRAALQKILASRLPAGTILLNKRFRSYRQTEQEVTADFEDGSSISGAFLVHADGIRSRGRQQLFPGGNLRYSGQTCWRFVTDFDLPEGEEANLYEFWSDKKGLRVGYSRVNERQVYVFITNYAKAGGQDDPAELQQTLLQLCAAFPEVVRNLISATDPRDMIRTDLFDFKPISCWVDKRVALLGDAAHATTPNLGQGACQAIEDAYVIAREMRSHSDIALAFKSYQDKRIKKAAFITNSSRNFAQMSNTSGLMKTIIKGFLRMTPPFLSRKQLDKIYTISS